MSTDSSFICQHALKLLTFSEVNKEIIVKRDANQRPSGQFIVFIVIELFSPEFLTGVKCLFVKSDSLPVTTGEHLIERTDRSGALLMLTGDKVPVFPLKTVLFPGSSLPLQIFEPRYLDMVRYCVQNDTGFIITLLQSGPEVSSKQAATIAIHNIGTYANIIDFQQLSNGLLGVTVFGEKRVLIDNTETLDNHLVIAEVSDYVEEIETPVPDNFSDLSLLLSNLLDQPAIMDYYDRPKLKDAVDISWRLSELLPLSFDTKQQLLATEYAVQRLHILKVSVEKLTLDLNL